MEARRKLRLEDEDGRASVKRNEISRNGRKTDNGLGVSPYLRAKKRRYSGKELVVLR